jgi:hypothetical protein
MKRAVPDDVFVVSVSDDARSGDSDSESFEESQRPENSSVTRIEPLPTVDDDVDDGAAELPGDFLSALRHILPGCQRMRLLGGDTARAALTHAYGTVEFSTMGRSLLVARHAVEQQQHAAGLPRHHYYVVVGKGPTVADIRTAQEGKELMYFRDKGDAWALTGKMPPKALAVALRGIQCAIQIVARAVHHRTPHVYLACEVHLVCVKETIGAPDSIIFRPGGSGLSCSSSHACS